MVLKQDFRFRPSIFGSFMYSSSQIMGQMVSFLGLNASESFIIGMKQAIGDYYNDQIRELYTPEFAQKHTEKEINLLKELFKQIRDEELAFVDTKLHVHSQTQTQMQSDEPVATKVGKMSTKFLLQLVQRC
jgi:demethoxyubiquinone hydroxylase (CLK1/Coq7/Cat5 family)